MNDNIDNALNELLGKRSNYTIEEIEEAKKRKKKNGGSLMDNLREVSGHGLPSTDLDINAALMANSAALSRELDDFTKALESEYKVSASDSLSAVTASESRGIDMTGLYKQDLTNAKEMDAAPCAKSLSTAEALEKFNGVEEPVKEKIFGQEDFIKKLTVAFKRPYVMTPEKGHALNSIFISGPDNTGRHSTLTELAKELKNRGILNSDLIYMVNLALYPSAGEEKLFLQDLYSALKSSSQIILFENYESCHSSYLVQLSELVSLGECRLSARYVMQNGQLVGVNNALAAEAVGTLSAAGKYIVFISEKSVTKLADAFGAPFVNALGDICITERLTEESLTGISEREWDKLKSDSSEKLLFEIEKAEDFIPYSITRAEKNRGLDGILDFYSDLYRSLAQLRLEGSYPAAASIAFTIEEGKLYGKLSGEKIDLFAALPSGYSGEKEAVKKELAEIVGLEKIKDYVLSLEEYYGVQKRRREEGLKSTEVSKHMIFTGSPGTGKTTIARIISRYLKAIGVLSGGQLVEVSRADLVGRYVGHTAPLTNQVIKSALGGVLFIDEAYSLYRGKDDSFGLEAIDTLVKGIEDNRDDLIVILAGYSIEMQEFLTSNSGLKSRFPNIIDFPDYTGEELYEISVSIARSKGYTIDEGAKLPLTTYYNAVQAVRAKDAGNGRLARNKIEDAILNQSRRLIAEPESDLSVLLSGDFELDDING